MVRAVGKPKFIGGPIGKRGGAGAVSSGYTVLGVPEAIAALRGVDAYLRLEMGLAVYEGAHAMEQLAKQYVGKETGNLESGIQVQKEGSYTYTVTASSRDGDVPEKAAYEYAPFHEFGWTDQGGGWHAGRFFMTRAYAETRPEVQTRVAAMAAAVERL